MSSEKLFAEFPDVYKEAWKEQAIADLKGADFDKKLVWNTLEGISLQPYYDQADLNTLDYLKKFENCFVNTSDGTQGLRAWANLETIRVEDEAEANTIALEALNAGADGVLFDITDKPGADLKILLRNIALLHASIGFIVNAKATELVQAYFASDALQDRSVQGLMGSIHYDPIYHYITEGQSLDGAFESLQSLIDYSDQAEHFYGLTVKSAAFLDAGSNTVQELAFTLAMAVEYIDRLTELGVPAEKIFRNLQFSMATGTTYFFEIAKLRALRVLVYQVAKAYGLDSFNPGTIPIHSHSAIWTKTIFDPYVNMLRNTTEAMSAIIGGCNSISIAPYNERFARPTALARRIARNVSVMLKEESYLNKVADPSAGSYYIETITDQLVSKAWELFKEIEAKGGFLRAFDQGEIKNRVDAVKNERMKLISSRREVLVGTNQYPNLKERMDPDSVVHAAQQPGAANLLKPHSAAQEFETLRLDTERFVKKHGEEKRPKVYLTPVGNNAAMRTARAMFSSGFFGCANFEVVEGTPSESLDETLEKAMIYNADIYVICGSDDDYATLGKEIAASFKKQKSDRQLVLAGYPADIVEELKAAGFDAFIHLRTNLIDSLRDFQKKLNVI